MNPKTYYLNRQERQQLMEHLATVLKSHDEVAFAYVYGSFAEGLPFHDIDVGVYVSEITEKKSTCYSLDVAQALSHQLKMPVDVRVLNFAPVPYLYHVIRANLVFERDEEIRMRVIEAAVQRYLDLKPMILRGIREAFAA